MTLESALLAWDFASGFGIFVVLRIRLIRRWIVAALVQVSCCSDIVRVVVRFHRCPEYQPVIARTSFGFLRLELVS